MDGVGEWPTTSLAIGSGNQLEIVKEIHFPHSLGLLYSAFTYYTGFKVNSGEYKVMGLAPYGNPIYTQLIFDNLVDLKEDGSFRLNMEYFDYPAGLTMTNNKFSKLFGGPPRKPESELTQREMDLAASIQAATEEIVLRMCRAIAKDTGQRNLCLAGGVALNCVANGELLRDGSFDNIWIQPAAGDAGGALGAALAVHHLMLGEKRTVDATGNDMQGSYLGTHYTQAEIEERLKALGAVFETVDDEKLINDTASALASGKAVGWHQGKMEFGPRALGNRSILGDPRKIGRAHV
jgi:carbamoyltransferase